MSGFLALAERCEQATGPDRALDAEIATALGWPDVRFDHAHGGHFSHDPLDEYEVVQAVPAYTASIDAAMTLVPEGLSVTIMFGPWVAGSVIILDPVSRVEWRADALTPALALCATALRARASQPTEGSE